MPIPKKLSKKNRMLVVGIPHSKRPDLTNLIKFTEDALNGVLWEDDSIIYEIYAKKVYGETPKTVIETSLNKKYLK